MKRVRSRLEATALISTGTRGTLADMPEAPTPTVPGPVRESPRPRSPRADRLRPRARPAPVLQAGRVRGGARRSAWRARAADARLQQLPRPDRRSAREGRRARRARALRDGAHRLAPDERDHPPARELEQEIAEWMGTEAALVFTTGYQANVGCLSAILGASDTVIADSGDHASILDGCKISGARLRPFRHQRLDKLERDARACRRRRRRRPGRRRRRLLDGGRHLRRRRGRRPLPRPRRAPDGRRGPWRRRARRARDRAPASCYGAEDRVDLRMGTFSKSLASCGGYIAGPADVIDYLRIASRSFLFTASAVPAATAAALEAVPDLPLGRGPGAVPAGARQRRVPARGLKDLGYRVVEPTRLADGSEVITPSSRS